MREGIDIKDYKSKEKGALARYIVSEIRAYDERKCQDNREQDFDSPYRNWFPIFIG